MLEKNEFITAEITGITSEGNGVCRVDGMAVFVPDTATGDIVKIKIVKVLKSYAYGIVDEIITPSPDRIIADCPVYKKCGGCTFRHIDYKAECRIKDNIVKDAFRRIGGLNPEFEEFIGAEKTSRYRNKAQYPLTSVDGKAVCGFYAERTHRVIPVSDCLLQPEVFRDILDTVLEYINSRKISVYSESTHTGIVRHIYVRQGTYSGEIMLCIVVRKDISRQLATLCRIIAERFPAVKSIVMNVNPDKTNVILGQKCVTLYGSDIISDSMCGNKIEISPLSFYQVNTVQAERIYRKALEFADPSGNELVADLYCGAGTIGLSMAKKVGKVVGIEVIPEAVENARKNAVANNITNAEFHCGDCGEIFKKLNIRPDIIVIDPPRKGCSQETIRTIAEAEPQKIVMISCNPATASRDAKLFGELGYRTLKVCGADLFPRTKHVECVVLMSREDKEN
ncbi:MAG: 23S rRNA (uracil(1939)-C(5))-methyltransferase RlmD [Ruminococcus sp.]|nr:23S rRNA (uracil(1939)-C(5))-methyltransferase RlmD [Ruminococcus sp.]